jgi:hypothetical protein|eukprot:COSAG01_NODE_1165_length_11446_cov_16.276196_10_plen_88_part_00
MQVGWLSRDGSPAGHLMLVGWLLLCRSAALPAPARGEPRRPQRRVQQREGAIGGVHRGGGHAAQRLEAVEAPDLLDPWPRPLRLNVS